jgi:methylenetetrahydrofolate reductase (NADPH)
VTVSLSFEVFPPKSTDGLGDLRTTVGRLRSVRPVFVSVTYGAGGSDRHRSFSAIDAVRSEGCSVAGHLTCVGQTRDDVDAVIQNYASLGVRRIVALRGDPPSGVDGPYEAHTDGYQRTADLVAAIKQQGDFDIAVSAYPEGHPQSPTADHDLDVLAEKVDAGADRAMTQMFFDNSHYLRYRDRALARGISIPIVPGIFPIHSLSAVTRFADRCGASMPTWIPDRFARAADDVDAARSIAAELAAEQISDLVANGVDHVHLFTLNRADLALAVCNELGVPSTAVSV